MLRISGGPSSLVVFGEAQNKKSKSSLPNHIPDLCGKKKNDGRKATRCGFPAAGRTATAQPSTFKSTVWLGLGRGEIIGRETGGLDG
jgi:hypothetical protein